MINSKYWRKKTILRKSLPNERHNRGNGFRESAFFNPEKITPLNDEEQKFCEGLIAVEECFKALKEFKPRKAPGTDGLPVEFYQFFWAWNLQRNDGQLQLCHSIGETIYQPRGIILLIPKKLKDKTILANLGPISLLNVDYNILTKAIAERLVKVLPNIINPDQTAGYFKDRYIGENIHLIQGVM